MRGPDLQFGSSKNYKGKCKSCGYIFWHVVPKACQRCKKDPGNDRRGVSTPPKDITSQTQET